MNLTPFDCTSLCADSARLICPAILPPDLNIIASSGKVEDVSSGYFSCIDHLYNDCNDDKGGVTSGVTTIAPTQDE